MYEAVRLAGGVLPPDVTAGLVAVGRDPVVLRAWAGGHLENQLEAQPEQHPHCSLEDPREACGVKMEGTIAERHHLSFPVAVYPCRGFARSLEVFSLVTASLH